VDEGQCYSAHFKLSDEMMSLSEAELNLIITPLNNDLCGTLTFHLSSVRVGKVKSQPM